MGLYSSRNAYTNSALLVVSKLSRRLARQTAQHG